MLISKICVSFFLKFDIFNTQLLILYGKLMFTFFSQYAMLLDIINNLLWYVEPHRKEALEKLARMRFQLQLHSVEDQRRPILDGQDQVKMLC